MTSTILISTAGESTHRWQAQFESKASDESLATLSDAFRDFSLLGQAGAFPAMGSDGADCRMNIVDGPRIHRRSVTALVQVVQCDPRYTRPLRNAIFSLGEMLEAPLIDLRLEDVRNRSAALKAEIDEGEVRSGIFYPGISRNLGVEIQRIDPANFLSARRVWLESDRSLSNELVQDLSALVDLWVSILASAYPRNEQELLAGETMILNAEGLQHDDVTFEVFIDRFIAAEAAFNSVVQLLATRAKKELGRILVGIE